MSGSSRSLITIHASGLRIGYATYIPAHSKNGSNISQRCEMTAYLNYPGRNGNEGRSEPIKITAWGKLGDSCARACMPGKEVHAVLSMNVYDGRVWFNDAPMNAPDGTPLMTRKTSFTVRELSFGAESAKHIAEEIGRGERPQFWNVPGHQDAVLWAQIRETKKVEQYVPGPLLHGCV